MRRSTITQPRSHERLPRQGHPTSPKIREDRVAQSTSLTIVYMTRQGLYGILKQKHTLFSHLPTPCLEWTM